MNLVYDDIVYSAEEKCEWNVIDKKPELFRIEFWDGHYQMVPAIIH